MLRRVFLAIAFLAISTASVTSIAANDAPNFVPPRLIMAQGIAYPDTANTGLVELWVNVDKFGYVKSTRIVRYVPSLTAALSNAVMGWQFSPAYLNGNAVESHITVYAVFNPGVLDGGTIPLTRPDWSWQSEHPAFAPPEISAAVYPAYPGNFPGGTVVVDMSLNKDGGATRSAAVYTTPALTGAAVGATGKWKFAPGTYDGAATDSHTVAAFVFRAAPIKRAD
jgi:hypothetical protein